VHGISRTGFDVGRWLVESGTVALRFIAEE
jgi:hypothetical protein